MFEIARAWFADPRSVGAIAPSSAALARALAREALRGRPGVILEVGAGSGAITRALRGALAPSQRLVAIDVNRQLLGSADAAGLSVQADAGALPIKRADVVVSGLPFGSLPEAQVRRILAALARIAPRIVFFQYTERRLPIVREYFPGARVVEAVYANLPPAQIVASPLPEAH